MDSIVILDYGSQYSQLIARRVREAHVYCQLFPYDAPAEQVLALNPVGFILSGSHNSVYDPGAPQLPDYVLKSGRPVLGICYGMQLLAHALGGHVAASSRREYGRAEVRPHAMSPDWVMTPNGFHLPPNNFQAWMSHGDKVDQMPPGFVSLAVSDNCQYAAMANYERGLYAIQFHPEVNHTEHGRDVLRSFLTSTGAAPT